MKEEKENIVYKIVLDVLGAYHNEYLSNSKNVKLFYKESFRNIERNI